MTRDNYAVKFNDCLMGTPTKRLTFIIYDQLEKNQYNMVLTFYARILGDSIYLARILRDICYLQKYAQKVSKVIKKTVLHYILILWNFMQPKMCFNLFLKKRSKSTFLFIVQLFFFD